MRSRSLERWTAALTLLAGAFAVSPSAFAQATTTDPPPAPASTQAPANSPPPPAAAPALSPSASPQDASVRRAPPPMQYRYPPPPRYKVWSPLDEEGKPREVWYGWQALIIHGISASLLAVSPVGDGAGAPFTIPTAITGMVFAGPIVHWAHGHTARGFGSLGLQFGGAALGALSAGGLACSIDGCSHGDASFVFLIGFIIGAPIGATAAFIADMSVLAFDPVTEQSEADMAKSGKLRPISFVPLVDIRKDRATFGLGGSF